MPASSLRVLDVDHLRRQTHGDDDLERELLALFEAQCRSLLPLISGAGTVSSRAEASHTLKGSALAVGAEQIASLSDTLELALLGQRSGEALLTALEDLHDAAGELNREIERWRLRASE